MLDLKSGKCRSDTKDFFFVFRGLIANEIASRTYLSTGVFTYPKVGLCPTVHADNEK